MKKEKSRTILLAEKLLFIAFKILKENSNEMRYDLLKKEIAKRINFNNWEKEIYEKNGYIRWEVILSFYSIDAVKAGYLIKNKGIWYLTENGEKSIELGKEKLLDKIRFEYKKWILDRRLNNTNNRETNILTIDNEEEIKENINNNIENIEASSKKSFYDFINNLDPYEFQDLCAALLRGMGYYTPFISTKGKDGGVDIIAYKDPLGASTPRIKVQVKHRENKSTVDEIRQLYGILKDDDIGVFISTGDFTPEAIKETKIKNKHIELININNFIDLWIEFFSNMKNEDKSLMPIKPIYFLY